MSGACSRHQGHDPLCDLCLAVPLSASEEAYYKGWDQRLEAIHRNGWVVTEAIVMDAFEELEAAVRVLVTGGQGGVGELQRNFEQLGVALAALDDLRRLKRGSGA